TASRRTATASVAMAAGLRSAAMSGLSLGGMAERALLADVEDASDDKKRKDADGSIDDGDRDGIVLREAEDLGQQDDHRDLDEAEACRRERHRGEDRGGHRDEDHA